MLGTKTHGRHPKPLKTSPTQTTTPKPRSAKNSRESGFVQWPIPATGAQVSRMTHPGRVGMWRGGGRLGLSVAAPFVWRCLKSRAAGPVSTPLSSNRTGATNASGSRTRQHTFAHGRSQAARRPTARAVVSRRTPIGSIARDRQCHHLGRPWLPRPTPRFSLRFGMRGLPQLSHISGVR